MGAETEFDEIPFSAAHYLSIELFDAINCLTIHTENLISREKIEREKNNAEILRMAEQGPTEEELDKAKRYLKGSYPLRFDTSTKIARQLVEIQRDDLSIDYINMRNDLIGAVTIEDARRVAQRLYGDGSLYMTMVGRPDGVETPAKGG